MPADDIYYNAVSGVAEESGNATGLGVGESLEAKLEALPTISAVEV